MNADTKKMILESARVLFTERGYRSVSTREIAEAAGVNLGSIQYHFGSKSRLFIETIHSLMNERYRKSNRDLIPDDITADDAAELLLHFIRTYMEDMSNPEGPDVSKLMCREINSATAEDPELCEALLQSVVEKFIRPNDSYLTALIAPLLPQASEHCLQLHAQSIIGQCAFYATHRLFLHHLRNGRDDTHASQLRTTISHIASFSLRGLGYPEQNIAALLERELS